MGGRWNLQWTHLNLLRSSQPLPNKNWDLISPFTIYCHLVVKKDEDTERRQAGGGEGVEGLEEEDELEVEGDGLQVGAQRRDRDELGDVEQEREHDHRRHVAVHRLLVSRVTLLKTEKLD